MPTLINHFALKAYHKSLTLWHWLENKPLTAERMEHFMAFKEIKLATHFRSVLYTHKYPAYCVARIEWPRNLASTSGTFRLIHGAYTVTISKIEHHFPWPSIKAS